MYANDEIRRSSNGSATSARARGEPHRSTPKRGDQVPERLGTGRPPAPCVLSTRAKSGDDPKRARDSTAAAYEGRFLRLNRRNVALAIFLAR
jgi:hypothetical protein